MKCDKCNRAPTYVEVHTLEGEDYIVSLCAMHLAITIKSLIDSVSYTEAKHIIRGGKRK